jgi:FkbM family methyltransferase
MRFYSQHGEDEILWDFFRDQSQGVCVEVGGFDGETFSNTLAFEEHGWRAIIVEPMPHFAKKIRARRPQATLFACAAGAAPGEARLVIAHGVEALSTTTAEPAHLERIRKMGGATEEVTVAVRTLDDLLAEAGVARVDFITIDVEGGEMNVLAGFDLQRWRPRMVILENGEGKKCPRLHDEMLRRGYHWFISTGCNEWYVPRSERAIVTPMRRLKNRLRRFGMVLRPLVEATGLKKLERTIRHKIKKGKPKAKKGA